MAGSRSATANGLPGLIANTRGLVESLTKEQAGIALRLERSVIRPLTTAVDAPLAAAAAGHNGTFERRLVDLAVAVFKRWMESGKQTS